MPCYGVSAMPADFHNKILVVSALSRDKLNEALDRGADDILEKPFDNKVLADKVESLLETE